jgi:hypothetical protein
VVCIYLIRKTEHANFSIGSRKRPLVSSNISSQHIPTSRPPSSPHTPLRSSHNQPSRTCSNHCRSWFVFLHQLLRHLQRRRSSNALSRSSVTRMLLHGSIYFVFFAQSAMPRMKVVGLSAHSAATSALVGSWSMMVPFWYDKWQKSLFAHVMR